MRVQLCYITKDSAEGKMSCKNYSTVKDAMIIWDTQISKIATWGCLRKWDVYNYYTHKILKQEEE